LNDNLRQFNALWDHVAGVWVASDLVLEIKKTIEVFFNKEPLNIRPLIVFSERIATHIGFEHFRKHELVSKVEGEWHITNSDLEFWANLCLFGDRDYFPGKWNWPARPITDVIHKKRRWQTLQRYYDNGGLKEDHKKLLALMNWDINLFRGDGVSLYVQGKRPFGNSSIEGDIIEILGWELDPDLDEYPKGMEERCWELFDELQFAIVDVFKKITSKLKPPNILSIK